MKKQCALCGSKNSKLHLNKDGYNILQCKDCSFIFLDYEPDDFKQKEFYSIEYFKGLTDGRGYEDYESDKIFLKKNFRRRSKHLNKYVKSGNVLDLGCAYGFFLDVLGENFDRFGMDISEHALKVANAKFNINAKIGPLKANSYPNNFFSLITMWDVPEHLHNLKSDFKICHNILMESGILALQTGDVGSLFARICGKKWHLYTVPEHLWYFSFSTLEKLAHDSGFEVVEMKHEWNYYSLDYLIERFVKTVFEKRSIYLSLPFKSFLRKMTIPVMFLDEIGAVLRKI
jgi:SAM-dependent methyltransferase